MPKNVQARYLAGTMIVMPHLEGAGGPHAGQALVRLADGAGIFVSKDECNPDALPAGAVVEIPDCAAVVVTGDVIPLDRYSAEARSDFEIVADNAKGPKARSAAPKED